MSQLKQNGPSAEPIKQGAAYLWGLAKDGTNLWWDLFFTFLATYFAVTIVDMILPDTMQETAFLFTNTIIIAVGALTWLAAWDRMRKDNRNRKVLNSIQPQQKQQLFAQLNKD